YLFTGMPGRFLVAREYPDGLPAQLLRDVDPAFDQRDAFTALLRIGMGKVVANTRAANLQSEGECSPFGLVYHFVRRNVGVTLEVITGKVNAGKAELRGELQHIVDGHYAIE